MALAEFETGSQTAIISTEHTLNTTTPETADGVFQVVIDTANMAASDVLEIRIKEKARSGDTQREIFVDVLNDAQSSPLWVGPALGLLHGWDITITQTAGTGRAFPWSIRQLA